MDISTTFSLSARSIQGHYRRSHRMTPYLRDETVRRTVMISYESKISDLK